MIKNVGVLEAMIANNYNKGRFPNKMKTLQDLAAEEVAHQIHMNIGGIHGDQLLYAQTMTDPKAHNSMLTARNKSFSNYSRRKQMFDDTQRFRTDMVQILRKLPAPAPGANAANAIRFFRDRVNHMYSDEAIAHATGTDEPAAPELLSIQTPRERLDSEHMPAILPFEFTFFVMTRLGLRYSTQHFSSIAHEIATKYATTPEAGRTVLAQLWREWSKSQNI